MKFSKYHALGNDYLVLTPQDAQNNVPSKSDTIKICHRNFGLGSDGILYGPEKSENAQFKLRIFNPDGSEAEKSGNGLRIFAKFLYDSKLVEENKPFTIDTLGGIVSCIVSQGGSFITVEMGRVSFDSEKIPVKNCHGEVLNQKFNILGDEYLYSCATVGNPHCVLPLKEISHDLACKIGPIIENMTELFPNRTNVQLLKILDRNNIRIEIWERGAGYTLASGSSSSAAASVAHKLGFCDNNITVHMPGGKIGIIIDKNWNITMSGPATYVGTYIMSDEVIKQVL